MPFGIKRFSRAGTKSSNWQDKGKAPEKPEVPSYHAQDQERRVQDSSSSKDKDDQKKDDEVKEDVGGEKDEEKNPLKTTPKPSTTKGKTVMSKQGTTTTTTVSGPFSRLWSKATEIKMIPIEFTSVSRFLPNGIPLMKVAFEMINLVSETNWVTKQERNFNPYGALTGIAFYYHLQILRAKEAAGDLKAAERTVLTRITKAIPEERMTVPEPLIPFISSIVATELSDEKYGWVVPTIGSLTELTSLSAFGTSDIVFEQSMVRPAFPLMLANLCAFGAMPVADLADRIDESNDIVRAFTPVEIARAAGTTFFGTATDTSRANWAGANANVMRLFLTCGFNQPFFFNSDNYPEAQRFMKRSGFFGEVIDGANVRPANNQATSGVDVSFIAGVDIPGTYQGAQTLGDKNCSTIERYMFAEKEKNLTWLTYLIEQVNIVAKHFPGSKTMADMPKVGGLASSIICDLRTFNKPGIANTRFKYANSHLNVAGVSTITYYMKKFESVTAYFRTVRGDIERQDELQAFTVGINATPPVHGITVRNFRTGEYFDHMEHGVDVNASEVGNDLDTVAGSVRMYDGYRNDYLRPVFTAKPQ